MSVRLMSLVFGCNMPEIKTDDGKTVPDTTAKSVLLALADNASDDGEGAYPGVDTLCKKTNYSTATVCNALNALRHNGFAELTGRSKYGTNTYRILAAKILEFQWLKQEDFSGYNRATLAAKTNPSVKPSVKPSDSVLPAKTDYSEDPGVLYQKYESEIGVLTPGIARELAMLVEQYGMAWVFDAMTISSERNKRSLSYIRGILQRWHADGRDNKPRTDSHPANDPARVEDIPDPVPSDAMTYEEYMRRRKAAQGGGQ